MELINCPKCKGSISNETAICPKCGFSLLKKNKDKKTNPLIYSPVLGIILVLVKCFASMSSQQSSMDVNEIQSVNYNPNSLYHTDSLAVPIDPYAGTERDSTLKYSSLNNDFRVFVVDKLDKKQKKEYSDIADHLDKENVKFEDLYREMIHEQENSNYVSNSQQDPYQTVVKANQLLLKLQQKYNISDEELRSIITLFLQNKNAEQLVTVGY